LTRNHVRRQKLLGQQLRRPGRDHLVPGGGIIQESLGAIIPLQTGGFVGIGRRAPEPPDPAYQQVLHGVPAADFSADVLLYLPRNVRADKLYGMSPVEQIALTINTGGACSISCPATSS